MQKWSVYMLRCGDGSLYTGIATDVRRRLKEHEQGKRGARYLRGRGPLELIYERGVGDRSVAAKIEHRIKQLPKPAKENVRQLHSRVDEFLKTIRENA